MRNRGVFLLSLCAFTHAAFDKTKFATFYDGKTPPFIPFLTIKELPAQTEAPRRALPLSRVSQRPGNHGHSRVPSPN